MVIRRVLGLIILLTALAIIAGSAYTAYALSDVLEGVATSIHDNLAAAEQTLATARNTLVLSRDTFDDVGGGLGTAVQATANASRTIADSQPMIDNVGTVVTQEVPEAVEGIQNALPGMIEVAGVIDGTLRTLSSIGIDRTINLPFGGSIPLQFDLGIDYNPAVPFDSTLRGFQASLDGLPESMRGLEDDLQTTSDNLGALAEDMQAASDNLAVINGRVGEVLPLLDQYLVLADQLSATLDRVDADIEQQLEMVRLGIIAVLVLLGLSQLAPLYLGWELLAGRREPARVAEQPKQVQVVETPALPTVIPILPQPETTEHPDEEWSPVAPPEDREPI
jgi:ABC-type transporter Mla subunit MlaD